MADPQVARVSGPSATLLIDGATREARIAPRLPDGPPVAGDRVEVRETDDDLVVTAIRPRATTLQRGDGPAGRPRVVVANADLLIVVASVAEPPLRPRLVDRYLVAAWAGGLDAALVLTKSDKEHDAAEVARVADLYRGIGYPVLIGSAKDPALVEEVRALIGGRVAALAGHSGVGKSTLTRGLTGVERAVGTVGKAGKGRHTTTDPRLIPLPGGGAVVDTAGVRTFFLPKLTPEELEAGFPEIVAAAEGCRFRGCRHHGEPDCAVEALVSPERFDSYQRLLADLA